MKNKIFNNFFTEFLFLKCFQKFLTKILVKKLSNILFSIKMENNILNSLSAEIFASPCVYKLIINIYIFHYSEAARHKNVWFRAGLEPPPRMFGCMRFGALIIFFGGKNMSLQK